MNVFLQFRLWARQGPTVERVMAATAFVLALVLFAWALVPTDEDDGPLSLSTAGSPGAVTEPAAAEPTPASGDAAPVTTSTPPSVPATASGTASVTASGTAAPAGGTPSPPASGCATPTGKIVVATTIFNVFGANSTVNALSPAEQRRNYDALWDTVNKAGGVQCHEVVGRYYEMNPLDQSSQQSGCLRIVADKPFAVVGAGGFFPAAQSNCIPRAKIPLFSYYGMTQSEHRQFVPYLFSVGARVDRGMATWVEGARQQGYFDPAKGFAKLGVFQVNCDADANASLDRALAAAGISGGKVSRFTSDCPISGQTPPNQCAQAVLQHATAGVTHVFLAAGGSPNFCYVNQAKRQGFQPKFSTSDYILGIAPQTVGEAPNPDAFDGALGITLTRFGAINAGFPADAGTKWCNAAYTSHGLPPISAEDGAGLVRGTACASVQMFVAAARRAPGLSPARLADGLATAGRVDLGWPASDAIFDRPGKVYGGDFYRPVIWRKACTCWRATSPAWSPSS